MNRIHKSLLTFTILCVSACTGGDCTESQAYDKMLALQRVEARIAARGGQDSMSLVAGMGMETGKLSELIAQKKYVEACAAADEFAKRFNIDFKEVSKGMVTFDELKKDGGKRGGECGLAEAAQRNMAFHKKLQEQVDAGKVDTDIFRQYNDDTKDFAELMSSDPSAVCKKLERLQEKYKVSF